MLSQTVATVLFVLALGGARAQERRELPPGPVEAGSRLEDGTEAAFVPDSGAVASRPVWLQVVQRQMPRVAGRTLAVIRPRGELEGWALELIGDQSRLAATEAVRGHGLKVVSADLALATLPPSRHTLRCVFPTCEFAAARAVGADLLIAGEVRRNGTGWTATVTLYDVLSESAITTASYTGTEPGMVIERTYRAVASLFQ